MHFEAQAADYARQAPNPPALWQRLRERGLLEKGRHALDLGARSGQATGRLLAAGLRVTAVEPGPRLANRPRQSRPQAIVVVARAEDVTLPAVSFDIAVAATLIHWADLDVVLPAVKRLLVLGGRFALWRNVFDDPSVITPFRRRVAGIARERDGSRHAGPDPEDIAATAVRLTRTNLFTVDGISRFQWRIVLDEQPVRRLFDTFSDWTGQEVDQAAAAVRDLGGSVTGHYRPWLTVLGQV